MPYSSGWSTACDQANGEQLFKEAGQINGQTFEISELMKDKIMNAGYVNVVEKVVKVPIGGWAADRKLRELGQYALL